jgi:hypothetical protein
MNIDRATAAQTLLQHRKPQSGPPVRSSDVVLLLEHCDAAMTAASSQLWDMNRDLALELNRRASRCRVMVGDLQQNTIVSRAKENQ